MTCIREHVTIDTAGRLLEANAERHLKPPQEMARLFRRAPDAIDRTLRFLDRCNFSLGELKQTEYPDENRAGLCNAAGRARGTSPRKDTGGAIRTAPIRKSARRSTSELEITADLKYAPYFLTVHDIVHFARSKGILCQGRGSAANSVICYCLGITEVDPEKVDLLFERFVSEGARRAARHRRRFRARAARGGDPVHLREIRPRSREPDRDRHLLSRAQRDPRGRQGLRAVGRHGRGACRHVVGLVDRAA